MPSSPGISVLCRFVILGAILVSAGALAVWARRQPARAWPIATVVGAVLGLNELAWYGYLVKTGLFEFPVSLPLDLCDIVLWLTVVALLTRRAWAFDLAYYWALAGTTMAVLMPDITSAPLSYPTIKFFASHGGVVAAVLFLVWGRLARPRRWSWCIALVTLNIYALAIGLFNHAFDTNFLYLCQKPGNPTILDQMGAWPWYLVWEDALALVLFSLLWLPFRPRGKAGLGILSKK